MRIVLFSYGYMPSGRLEPYRERLAQVLIGAGAEVLVIKTNSFYLDYSHLPRSREASELVKRVISQFDPDLAISINRTGFTSEVRSVLGPSTPRVTWFQDPYYYATPELLSYDDNDILFFIFPNPTEFEKKIRPHALGCGAKIENVHNVPFCLDDYTFFPTNDEKDVDISFVGSSFSQDYSILLLTYSSDVHARTCLIDLLLEHRSNYVKDIPATLHSRGVFLDKLASTCGYVAFHEAIRNGSLSLQGVFDDQLNMERRIQHLSALADFNLVMFGLRDDIWLPQMCVANPKLLRAYRFSPIESPTELAQLYRRTKIGFNISRVAAAGVGFSFRVPELLATGALLMTESGSIPALQNLGFVRDKHYVVYSDPQDLKRLCSYYLDKNEERNRIVQAATDHLNELAKTSTISALLSSSLKEAGFSDFGRRILDLGRDDVPETLMAKVLFIGDFGGGFSGQNVIDVSALQDYSTVNLPEFVPTEFLSFADLPPHLAYNVKAFCAYCQGLAEGGNLESALRLIIDFVLQIVVRDSSTARVFSSRELDALCQRIGELTGITATSGAKADHAVFIVTSLGITGGHSRVVRDLISAGRSTQKTVLVTGTLIGNPTDLGELEAMLGARVEAAPNHSYRRKLRWLQCRLRDINGDTTYILQHHFDAVCTAAVRPDLSNRTVYFHNADHNLCLGVHLPHVTHVDFNEKGFFNCRENEGVVTNILLPLKVTAPPHKRSDRFDPAFLVTCCCGGFEKFELPHKLESVPYSIAYADVVATRLSAAPGEHLHIGPLSAEMKSHIVDSLENVGIPADRFVQLDHVDELSAALVERSVDVYMGSMPRGGGRATVEAMAAGIPLLLHSNYRTLFLSDENEVYPGALVWRTLDELRGFLKGLTDQQLCAHAERSYSFFKSHHDFGSLQAILDTLLSDGPTSEPKRRAPLRPTNPLQAWMDEYHAGPVVPLLTSSHPIQSLSGSISDASFTETATAPEGETKISGPPRTALLHVRTKTLFKTVVYRVWFKIIRW